MVRITAHFSGTVQGVGFRYTTVRLAQNYPSITGIVRNLSDGRVQLVAEGEPLEVQSLIRQVQDRMHHYIKSVQTHEEAATGEYQRFAVSF